MDGAGMRERMLAGETVFGLGVRLSRTGEIALVAKAAGFDWLFVDMEHNALSIDTAAQICLAAQAAGLPALVRVPGDDPLTAARLLDGGAAGIVVPHVDRPEQIAPLIERCRFPPKGRRSIGGPLPQLHYELGRAYRGTGEPDKAAAAFRRAIELAPESPLAEEALRQLNALGK